MSSHRDLSFGKTSEIYQKRFIDNVNAISSHLKKFIKGYDLEKYNDFIMLSDNDFDESESSEKSCFTFYILFFGRKGSVYDGGYYLGQIVCKPTYPFSNPDIYMLNNNARFNVSIHSDRPICLNISGYHDNSGNAGGNMIDYGYDFNLSFYNPATGGGVNHVFPTPPDSEFKKYASLSLTELQFCKNKTITGIPVYIVFQKFYQCILRREKKISANGGVFVPNPSKSSKIDESKSEPPQPIISKPIVSNIPESNEESKSNNVVIPIKITRKTTKKNNLDL